MEYHWDTTDQPQTSPAGVAQGVLVYVAKELKFLTPQGKLVLQRRDRCMRIHFICSDLSLTHTLWLFAPCEG